MELGQIWRDYAVHVAGAVTAVGVISVAGLIFRSRFPGLFERILGRQIKITSPQPGEAPQDPRKEGENTTYRITGSLRHLPKDHEIWLVVGDPTTGQFWPQGRDRVGLNPKTHEWHGRVTAGGSTSTIFAVVAPPTAHDFFQYFRKVAPKTGWEPLSRIPAECTNRDSVVVRLK